MGIARVCYGRTFLTPSSSRHLAAHIHDELYNGKLQAVARLRKSCIPELMVLVQEPETVAQRFIRAIEDEPVAATRTPVKVKLVVYHVSMYPSRSIIYNSSSSS